MSAPTILRDTPVQAQQKLEIAVGGNITQWIDSSGNRVASMLAGTDADAGYPVDKVIDGQEQDYDYSTDTDTNYCRIPSAAANPDTIIDLGAVRSFNQLVLYGHGSLANATWYKVYGSPDNVTYTQIYDTGTGAGPKLAMDVGQCSYRYIKVHPVTFSADNYARICELQVFNWADVSADIVMEGEAPDTVPDIQLMSKGSSNQNATATPSELQVTLNNTENYYSPWNAGSPYYGIQGPDGLGNGMRAQARIRLSVTATSPSGSFSTGIFYGIIANDNNPGGTDGITYSQGYAGKQGNATGQSGRACMVVAKSLLSRLDTVVSTPVYEGAPAYYIIGDVCQRCGISLLDLSIGRIEHGVPYVAFPQQSGTSILNVYLASLPFLRVFETYNNQWSINVVNHGRTKFDATLSRLMGTSAGITPPKKIIKGFVNSPGDYFTNYGSYNFVFDSNNNLYRWDVTKDMLKGATLWGTSTAFATLATVQTYGTSILFVDTSGNVKTFDATLSALGAITTVGTFSGIDSGYTHFWGACSDGTFMYVVMGDSAGAGANTRLYVWDMRLAFSTTVSKGILTHSPERPTNNVASPLTVVQPSGMGVDATYLIYKYGNISFTIWKHAGTPYTTALTTVDAKYFTSASIGGEDYQNNTIAFSWNEASPSFLEIAVSVGKASGLRRLELWGLDIGTAWATPSTTATFQGVLADDTSALIVLPGDGTATPGFKDTGCLVMNGSYVYVQDSEFNLWVWDTNKAFSFVFALGVNMPSYTAGIAPMYAPLYQTPSYQTGGGPGVIRHCGPSLNGNQQGIIWFTRMEEANEFGGSFTGFSIAADPFGTPSVNFDIADGFTEDVDISIGNPTANDLIIQPAPYALQTSAFVWNQPTANPMYFPSNQKTTVPFQLNGTSYRGGRYFHCSTFATSIPDDPAATTSITIGGNTYPVTFFAFSDMGYLTIDCTGLPLVAITGGTVNGRPASQPFSASGFIEEADPVSQSMYEKVVQQVINTPLFNDTSFYQDLLLNGKYMKPYVQGWNMPWFPIMTVGQVVGIANSVLGMPLTDFEVVEFTVDGLETSFNAQRVMQTFNI